MNCSWVRLWEYSCGVECHPPSSTQQHPERTAWFYWSNLAYSMLNWRPVCFSLLFERVWQEFANYWVFVRRLSISSSCREVIECLWLLLYSRSIAVALDPESCRGNDMVWQKSAIAGMLVRARRFADCCSLAMTNELLERRCLSVLFYVWNSDYLSSMMVWSLISDRVLGVRGTVWDWECHDCSAAVSGDCDVWTVCVMLLHWVVAALFCSDSWENDWRWWPCLKFCMSGYLLRRASQPGKCFSKEIHKFNNRRWNS